MSHIKWPVKHGERLSKYQYKLAGNKISLTTSPSSIVVVINNTYLNEHGCDSIKLDLKQQEISQNSRERTSQSPVQHKSNKIIGKNSPSQFLRTL